jgi:hypothetical protein
MLALHSSNIRHMTQWFFIYGLLPHVGKLHDTGHNESIAGLAKSAAAHNAVIAHAIGPMATLSVRITCPVAIKSQAC